MKYFPFFNRDPDGHIYFREKGGSVLAGGFEPVAKPAFEDGLLPTSSKSRQLQARQYRHIDPVYSSPPMGRWKRAKRVKKSISPWLQVDWDHFYVLLEAILKRLPPMESAILGALTNGPEACKSLFFLIVFFYDFAIIE